MATVQIQKTRNASTITKTAIDQKQSLEVVQTMLHGGVCGTREFKCSTTLTPMYSSAASHTSATSSRIKHSTSKSTT